MQYRYLGNTDERVSVICLGTMTWGEQNSEAEAHEQMDLAVERGVNFFDTAEMYPVPPRPETQGETERHIGTWFNRRGQRDDIFLATKASGPGVDHVRNGRPSFDRQGLREALDASLERMQTDYVDLYQLHWPERHSNFFGRLGYTPDDDPVPPRILETLEALGELVEEGRIRYIGLSNETPWGAMKFLQTAEERGLPRAVSVQNPYNLLNRTYEIGLAEVSHREQCGLLAYSPLGFGVLSGKYVDGQRPTGARLTEFTRFTRYLKEAGQEATRRYIELARDHGVDPAQLSLAYVNTRPFVTSNIVGATTLEQLKSNIDSIDLTLSNEVLEGIEAIHGDRPNPCP